MINLEILNIGPIKEVKITLNKINVFIGEQSSGKSTIAKIISFCQWVEKDISIRQSYENYITDDTYFIDKLASFHKMDNYFNENSEIIYESDAIKIKYKKHKIQINWKDRYNYKRIKISYIPSERSIAVLPEMEKVELPNNYIKSFLFDWFDARKVFSEKEKLSLLNLDAFYYFSENSRNNITNTEKSYNINLTNASSGLQSITPLIVMIEYLTEKLYLKEQNSSYELDKTLQETNFRIFKKLVMDEYNIKHKTKHDLEDTVKNLKEGTNDELIKLFKNYQIIFRNLSKTNNTSLIIEEPEQNLFPSTQKHLIYYLLNKINKKGHILTLTTHSPYVLYAMNNCIMADIVENKLTKSEKERLSCLKSKVKPTQVSIYQIKDGKTHKIQNDDGLINDNYFDEQMKNIMNEYYIMLNRY